MHSDTEKTSRVWSLIVTAPGEALPSIIFLHRSEIDPPLTTEEAVGLGRVLVEQRGLGAIHGALPVADPQAALDAWFLQDETPLSRVWELLLIDGKTQTMSFPDPVSRLDALSAWCGMNESDLLVRLDPASGGA